MASGLWSRFWGLMFRKELPEGQALLLTPCSSVHCFFMRFPIDVVFLDGDNRVTKIVPAMKPWRIAAGGGGKQALELPAGKASQARLKVGDQVSLVERDAAGG